MIYTITDESKLFSAFFAATINGSEVVLTIDSAGLQRLRLRIPIGRKISADERKRVHQFLTAQQIEAVLTPKEAQAVISINADLLLQFETPGMVVGPRPPPGARVVFDGNTPGLALVELNLNPNQIESLMGQSVMQSRYARPPR